RATVDGALEMAQIGVSDVDFWVFNTPNAWYADFCAEVLGVEVGRYHSVFARYANIGAGLMPSTLYHAFEEGRVKTGDLVGLYATGSTSTAAAAIRRIGDIALGTAPERPARPNERTWCETLGEPAIGGLRAGATA